MLAGATSAMCCSAGREVVSWPGDAAAAGVESDALAAVLVEPREPLGELARG